MKRRHWFLALLLTHFVFVSLHAADDPAVEKKPIPAWVVPAAVTGGALAVSFALDWKMHARLEKSANGEMGEWVGPKFGKPGGVAETLGRPEFVVLTSGLIYMGGAWKESDRAKRFAVTLTEATLVSGTAALGAKFVFGRERPTGANDPDTFHFFHGTSKEQVSFPSGHATTAFTWAAVTAEEFPSPWVAVGAYGAAGIVGFSRLYQHEHWVSDVVAGAALGYFTGKAVYRWEKNKGFLKGLYTDGRGIYWRMEF